MFNGKVTIKAIKEMDYMFIFDFLKENINIENLEKHKYCKGTESKCMRAIKPQNVIEKINTIITK